MITILQLAGIGDRDEVLLISTDISGQKRFLEIDKVSPLLEPLNPKMFRHRKLLYGGLNNRTDINIQPNLIFNSISDPDRCSRVLARAQNAAKENPFPFINHPDLIPNVRPDKLYELTKEIKGLFSPKCIRITPRTLSELQKSVDESGITTPFIVKEAGTDPESPNSFLLEKVEEIHALERFAFDGKAYYVKQFHDYTSKDKLYRKYRFFVIGEEVLPGHLIISTQWHITNDGQAHKAFNEKLSRIEKEEKVFLKQYQNRKLPALHAIKEHVGLDFFAIDCSIDNDGEIVLFGIDCEAHYFERVKSDGYYNQKQIQRYNAAVESMILTKSQQGGSYEHV